MKNNKGFTLIELLVVIAVIGILASVIVASLNTAREKGRDARRMRDIQEIRNAIELYIATNGKAPDFDSSCGDPFAWDYSCYANDMDTAGHAWSELETALAPYMSPLPTDPCGEGCFQKQWMHDGFFTYIYGAPATLSYLDDQAPGTGAVTNTSYRIYAQNLETRQDTFGFGPGSF